MGKNCALSFQRVSAGLGSPRRVSLLCEAQCHLLSSGGGGHRLCVCPDPAAFRKVCPGRGGWREGGTHPSPREGASGLPHACVCAPLPRSFSLHSDLWLAPVLFSSTSCRGYPRRPLGGPSENTGIPFCAGVGTFILVVTLGVLFTHFSWQVQSPLALRSSSHTTLSLIFLTL